MNLSPRESSGRSADIPVCEYSEDAASGSANAGETERSRGLADRNVRAPRWEDFRDHLATAEKDGTRRWVYPKKVTGKWFCRRTWFSWFLLGLMFVGPFVKIGGN